LGRSLENGKTGGSKNEKKAWRARGWKNARIHIFDTTEIRRENVVCRSPTREK